MIVWGFADELGECAQTLSGDYGRTKNTRQRLSGGRRRSTAAVSGASGEFDFYGTDRLPENAKTISVEFDVYGVSFDEAEERARELVDALHEKKRSKLWFIAHEDYVRHAPPDLGATLGGQTSGIVRISGSPQSDARVSIRNADGREVASGASETDGSYFIDNIPTGTYTGYCEYWSGSARYTDTIATITVTTGTNTGFNFNLTTDADTYRWRWAYAKLLSATVVEESGRSDRHAIRVETEFLLSEGVFYGAPYSVGKDEGDAKTFDATYLGSAPGLVSISFTPATNNVTAFKLNNDDESIYAQFSGTVSIGDELLIDAGGNNGAGLVTNGGTDAYSSLSRATGQLPFFYIAPDTDDAQQLTLTLTQTGGEDYNLVLTYYDTYGGI